MSMRTLEAEILREARVVARAPRLRQKDIMQWRTGNDTKGMTMEAGDQVFYLPTMAVTVIVNVQTK